LLSKNDDFNLSSYLRDKFETTLINENNIIENIVKITDENDLDLFRNNAKSSMPEFSQKQFYLLKAIETAQKYVGERIFFCKTLDNNPSYTSNLCTSFCTRLNNEYKGIFDYEIVETASKKLYLENGAFGYEKDTEEYIECIFDFFVKLMHKRKNEDINRFIEFYIENYPSRFEILIDYLKALSYSSCDEEFEYCLKNLATEKYIEYERYEGRAPADFIQIAPKGYEYLEKQKGISSINSKKAFIAIKFGDKYKSVSDTIKKVIEENNYKPIRADEEHHTEYIMDRILSDIKDSKFIIAELSSINLGVYYEAGYAIGKGIPVIAVANKKKKRYIHFDLKQFNMILYQNEGDLEKKLSDRIANLFGKAEK
jgi:nucleoside 2-deoxyribosyltransferase